ncbi:tRNA epoxyqueuosine(34) reductase QueG [Thermophagus sp. OGC60D27]|uniref:tRNA epoxyqueuosine(34) reductase QueG n=1 Tax=Thermophagus sp. OGC60D27 TaxID=3458415 RepID=UPI00403827C2
MDLVALERSRLIRQEALRLGFDEVGFASATELKEDAAFLKEWLNRGYHAGMDYMSRNFEKRTNPQKLIEDAKSVVVVLQNYFPPKKEGLKSGLKLAKYAYGRDYHKVLKKRLKQLMTYIQSEISDEANGRFFVDSAPVLERSLAVRAGLGWRGKNSNLIHPRIGSFVFIGEIILNIELPSGEPIREACGGCTRCIEACPTGALVSPYRLDANRCISYLTIENKNEIPDHFREQMNEWFFGCDICQDVCPWNWKARPHKESDFVLRSEFQQMTRDEWSQLDENTFDEISRGSPIRRAGYQGLKRNLNFILGQ